VAIQKFPIRPWRKRQRKFHHDKLQDHAHERRHLREAALAANFENRASSASTLEHNCPRKIKRGGEERPARVRDGDVERGPAIEKRDRGPRRCFRGGCGIGEIFREHISWNLPRCVENVDAASVAPEGL